MENKAKEKSKGDERTEMGAEKQRKPVSCQVLSMSYFMFWQYKLTLVYTFGIYHTFHGTVYSIDDESNFITLPLSLIAAGPATEHIKQGLTCYPLNQSISANGNSSI